MRARRSHAHLAASPGEQSRLLLRVRGADSCSTETAGMRKRAAASAPSTRVSAAVGDDWNGGERRQVYWDSFLTAMADGGWYGATGGRSYVWISGSYRRTRGLQEASKVEVGRWFTGNPKDSASKQLIPLESLDTNTSLLPLRDPFRNHPPPVPEGNINAHAQMCLMSCATRKHMTEIPSC